MTPTWRQLLTDPAHLLAFGLGSGLSPRAPGTVGTVVAALVWWLLGPLSPGVHLGVLLLLVVVGTWAAGRSARALGVHDHGGIVIDEWAGFWLTVTALPHHWGWLLGGFVLFRFFDIVKPWPIGWLDRRVHGGWGIMVDDLVAGLLAWLILFAVLWATEHGGLVLPF